MRRKPLFFPPPQEVETQTKLRNKGHQEYTIATLNGRIGYKISPRVRIDVEGYNLTNRKDAAIDYYYASRLPNEPDDGVGTADKHFHPIESRSFRVNLITTF